jgi:hypothetical protein
MRTFHNLAVLALLAAPMGFAAAAQSPAGTDANGTDSAEGSASRESDLTLAETRYVMRSPAFSAEARRKALDFIVQQKPRVASMTAEEFMLCVLAIPAFADNGHDVLNDSDLSWSPSARLPLRMIWFPDGWVVARAAPEFAPLLGARVRTIEGLGSDEIFRRVRRLQGGPDSSRRWNLEWVIEDAGMLHALHIAKRADGLRLALRLPGGARTERTVRFVPTREVPPGEEPVRLWSPELWPAEVEKGWKAGVGVPQPLYLLEGNEAYRLAPLPELDTLYVEFRSHLDRPAGTLAAFMRTVDQAIDTARPRNLIVDLRFDTGGNIDLTRAWQRTVVSRIRGEIFVLIGRYTFSAGIVAAAAFKHDAAGRAVVVGEEPGDRLIWWSEGENVCLPYSQYCLHLTTGLWNLESGCAGQPGCYGDHYDASVRTLRPDVSAPLGAADWLAGRDPGMEAIVRRLKP